MGGNPNPGSLYLLFPILVCGLVSMLAAWWPQEGHCAPSSTASQQHPGRQPWQKGLFSAGRKKVSEFPYRLSLRSPWWPLGHMVIHANRKVGKTLGELRCFGQARVDVVWSSATWARLPLYWKEVIKCAMLSLCHPTSSTHPI